MNALGIGFSRHDSLDLYGLTIIVPRTSDWL
jgi:hypothetical protein